MLIEEEISKESPTKTGSNLKRNNQNKDKKANNSKKTHAIHHFIENTPVGTTYTQALKQLLVKGKINLLNIEAEIEAFRKFKTFDSTKYCKYHRPPGYDTKNYCIFKNRLEKMFRS